MLYFRINIKSGNIPDYHGDESLNSSVKDITDEPTSNLPTESTERRDVTPVSLSHSSLATSSTKRRNRRRGKKSKDTTQGPKTRESTTISKHEGIVSLMCDI